MRQRDVAALDAKCLKVADAKAENDALRDDVTAGRRQLHIKASLSVECVETTTASGVDNAASRLANPQLNGDYFTLQREADHPMQKQLEGTQKYINEQCRRVTHIQWATHAIVQPNNTHALPAEYKCLK